MERALGFRTSANSAGAAVWPLVGGAAGTLAWSVPFGVYLVALPLGLLAVATVPETGAPTRRPGGAPSPEPDGGASSREADETPGTQTTDGDGNPDASTTGGRRARLAATLGVLRANPGLPLAYLLALGTNALLYVVVVFYPQFLPGVGVTSSLAISVYLAANGAAGGLSAALYDRLVRRVDRSRLVFGAFGLWLVGFGLATAVETPLGAVVPVVLLGLGVGVVFPSTFAWVEAFAPPEAQGQFGSYVATFGYTGQFLSPVVFGPLVPLVGLRGVFGAAATVAGVAAVGLGGWLLAHRG
jgi:MFS family permease